MKETLREYQSMPGVRGVFICAVTDDDIDGLWVARSDLGNEGLYAQLCHWLEAFGAKIGRSTDLRIL